MKRYFHLSQKLKDRFLPQNKTERFLLAAIFPLPGSSIFFAIYFLYKFLSTKKGANKPLKL